MGNDRFGTTAAPKKQVRASEQQALALTIISHPNPKRMGERAYLLSLQKGQAQAVSRTTPDFAAPGRFPGMPLDDPFISRAPIFFKPDGKGGVILDPGEGRTAVAMAPHISNHHFPAEILRQGSYVVLADRVVLCLRLTTVQKQTITESYDLIGHSDHMIFLRGEIARVVGLQTPVLLRGPSGTGKELTARAIHFSGNAQAPFVSVNLGAIPANLAASELFGAVKGSFTGADRHQTGFFKAAEGGTLFLDEVGEASPEVQVMLLRALESGEITPVGSQRSVKVRTRIISATDADLDSAMEDGSFKTPLFHRLSGYEITLPALTERLDDFGRLFLHFAHDELGPLQESHRLIQKDPYDDPWLPAGLMVDLLSYAWPGNIRQLRNVVRQLVIGCRGESCLRITPKVAEMLSRFSPQKPESPLASPPVVKRNPAQITPEELERVLEGNRWDILRSAKQLGVARGTLYKLIRQTEGLHLASDLTRDRIESCMAQHHGDLETAAYALRISPGALRQRLKEWEPS